MRGCLLRATIFLTLFCPAVFGAESATREPRTREGPPPRYAEATILAKPRAQAIKASDEAELRDHLRERQRFARLGDLRVLEVPTGETVEELVTRLRATGRYEFVEPDYLMSVEAVPNDPQFAAQWALNNLAQAGGSSGADIKAVAAWDIVREAPNVVVAIIDTGARLDHQDLAPNLWVNPSPTFGDVHGATFFRGTQDGQPTDDNGHGTHVAGIIGAVGNNGVGVAGVAWRTQLMVLKNAGADGFSSASDTVACIEYAIAHRAHVINCSFGGTAFSQALFAALQAARDAGIIIVAAAGNSGLSNDLTPHYPSNYLVDNVVSVGNSDASDNPSDSSNFGASVELFAPGTSILSLSPSSPTATVNLSGTSMSAPFVSGALALLKARFPADNHRQLINRLLRGADRKTSLAGRAQSGGRLDLRGAVTTTTNRPYNDDFASRATIRGQNLSLRAHNGDATSEADDPRPGGVAGAATLWWEWSPTTTGTVAIETTGSAFDTILGVYAATGTLASLTPIATNDDAPGLRSSRVTIPVIAGRSYAIVVGAKGSASGYCQLNIAEAQAGDVFTNPILLSGESATSVARNNFAAGDPAEPRIAGRSGGVSIWHKWTAPRAMTVHVSAFSADFDTMLALYSGTAVHELKLLASSDDMDLTEAIPNSNSRCTFTAAAGESYFIQVDSKNANTRGTFTLTVTESLWQLSTGGEITGSPALATDGTAYFATIAPDSRVYAVDADGTLKWTHALGGGVDLAAPAVGADGTVYVGSLDGRLTAFRPEGSVRWRRDFGGAPGAVSVSPAIGADGTLYVHSNDGYLYALVPNDGSVRWRFDVGTTTTAASAVIAADGTIYQPSNDQNFYALNPDGTLRWKYLMGGSTQTTPALDAAGNIYAATSNTGRLFSLTPGGSLRWSYNAAPSSLNALTGSPALSADSGTVYIGSGNGRFHAVNAATGAARWVYTAGGGVVSSTPAIDSNGVVYFGAADGKLYALNPSGSLRRTWNTAVGLHSSPAILGSALFVGSRDTKLYAFDIGAFVANGPWPMYRQNARRTGFPVSDAPAFAVMPRSQSAGLDEKVALSATAVGQGQLSYQWTKNGVAIAGATSATYTIPSFRVVDAGSYAVIVTNARGSTTSAVALLSLSSANSGRLVNLSILTELVAGETGLIVGMSIGGASVQGTKPIVFRAAGPSLTPLGVASALPDPRIELFSGPSPADVNDNWGGTALLAGVFDRVGAFRFSASESKDAAIYSPALSTGSYTVQVSGVGGATGTLLAELYDATPHEMVTAATPRLVNVSVLKQIRADSALVAGFVIAGATSKQVLVRAVGPTLASPTFGVAGTLTDPRIDIYRSTERIDGNEDWGGGATLQTAFASVGAFPLEPASRDAAVVVTLPPGEYSARVSGAPGTSGVALVEVYEVP